jgi:hypothetical protein
MPRGVLGKDGDGFPGHSFHLFDLTCPDRLNHLLHELTLLGLESWHIKDILCSPGEEWKQ